jgi:GT2 family glycosyltransferase
MSEHESQNKIAVLVINRNGASFLHDCFKSLLKNGPPRFDIYLIDNHSADNSVELCRTHYPMVNIMENDRNYGFAGAYDRAIRQLAYEYVVLLNNDTIVNENWLEALYRVAERDARIAACGSKILMAWNREIVDHAGGMLTLIGSGLDLGKWEKDHEEYNDGREIGFGCGCSLLIRREIYLQVGGFDPSHIIYHEDVDLCWKMRLFGYSVMYVPDSIVYHHLGGGTIQSAESPLKSYLCQKNRLANILQNLESRTLLTALFVSTAYDTVRIFRFIRLGRGDLLKALFRGYGSFFLNMKNHLRRRRMVQRGRVVSDKEIRGFFSPLVTSALIYRKTLKVQDLQTRK